MSEGRGGVNWVAVGAGGRARTYAVGCSWVTHRVTAVAVGDVLEDERALAGRCPFAAVLNRGLYGEDIHAVDLEAGNVLTARVVVGRCGGAIGRGTHAVLVVCASHESAHSSREELRR